MRFFTCAVCWNIKRVFARWSRKTIFCSVDFTSTFGTFQLSWVTGFVEVNRPYGLCRPWLFVFQTFQASPNLLACRIYTDVELLSCTMELTRTKQKIDNTLCSYRTRWLSSPVFLWSGRCYLNLKLSFSKIHSNSKFSILLFQFEC